jgi:two-component system response regulator HydG
LNVVAISLPPLRERREDIPILIDHFLLKNAHETGRPAPELSPEAMRDAIEYGWPGNVRELENFVERAILFSTQGVIGVEALPSRMLCGPDIAAPRRTRFPSLDEVIRHYVQEVLSDAGGNQTRAAKILGISRRTLHRMAARERRVERDCSDNVTGPGPD